MVRTLYRIYLYIVTLVLLFFAAILTAFFLSTVVSQTPLNGPYHSQIDRTQIVQQAAFAVIAWVAFALIGGLHYWLIRRDMASDPSAGGGATRAFFLNAAEAIATYVALLAGTIAFMATRYSGAAPGYAVWAVFLALFALLEVERRRTSAGQGAAIILQRLRLYGIQMIALIFFVISSWINALTQTVLAIFVNMHIITPQCNTYSYEHIESIPNECYVNGIGLVDTVNLGWLWATVVWVTVVWLGYALLARNDAVRSRLRQVTHFIGLGIGIAVLLYALERAVEIVAGWALGVSVTAISFLGRQNFISPALAGLLVVACYVFWLRRDVARAPQESTATRLIALALTSGLMAIVFWAGVAVVGRHIFESVVPGGETVDRSAWATGIALVVAGVGYIPFAQVLRIETKRPGALSAPRRGFVLIVLALGTLTTAIGLIVLAYSVVTAALGAPVSSWQTLARASSVSAIVGAVIVGIYLWLAVNEHWFRAAPAEGAVAVGAMPAPVPVPAGPAAPANAPSTATIEAVLDELLAGRLTREQASERIKTLSMITR